MNAELTDVQVNCLRLVADGYTSKEIAKQLGLTPMTVDQYLQRAKKTMGAPDRRTAARWLVENAQPAAFKPFELKSPDIAAVAVAVTPLAASEGDKPAPPATDQWQTRIGFPPLGGIRTTLDDGQKTQAILRIAGLSLIYTTAFALVLGGALKAFS
ncbi:helix-turn-helix domain-containing protein [Sphingomonas sp. 35-24ZXX]|uniref:helix-turn-helix domain-containing protein n=1 Tax=Sphingomonas sp. 35-24ZXX TaxID=1545915 RepID=UPI00053BFE85|nr:helix-turn-helix transcriptional regulator [Sphingomonas sp. 35-24ZXX]